MFSLSLNRWILCWVFQTFILANWMIINTWAETRRKHNFGSKTVGLSPLNRICSLSFSNVISFFLCANSYFYPPCKWLKLKFELKFNLKLIYRYKNSDLWLISLGTNVLYTTIYSTQFKKLSEFIYMNCFLEISFADYYWYRLSLAWYERFVLL